MFRKVPSKEAQTEAETLKEDRNSLEGIEYMGKLFNSLWQADVLDQARLRPPYFLNCYLTIMH